MHLIHFRKRYNELDKFIWFEQTDPSAVHNEIIKYNLTFSIAPQSIYSFLQTLLGVTEFNKLNPRIKNPATFHGECRNFTRFKEKTNAADTFNTQSGNNYVLHEIGIDIHTDSTRYANHGNIEIKYKHPSQDKMIVLNMHIKLTRANFPINDYITDFKSLLNLFHNVDKAKIDTLENMNVLNFGYQTYEVAPNSVPTFNIVLAATNFKMQEKIENLEKVKTTLSLFFSEKVKCADQPEPGKLLLQVSQEDLEDLGSQVSECKMQ